MAVVVAVPQAAADRSAGLPADLGMTRSPLGRLAEWGAHYQGNDTMFHNTNLSIRPCWLMLVGAVLLLLILVPPVGATDLTAGQQQSMFVVFGGTISKFFSGAGARGRVIQVCVACAAVALFILMKKFTR